MKWFAPVWLFVVPLYGLAQKAPDDAWIEKMLRKADSCFALRSLDYAREYYAMAFEPMTKNAVLQEKRLSKRNNFFYCIDIITADTAYANKEYEQAARQYARALERIPNDSYATTQLQISKNKIPIRPLHVDTMEQREMEYNRQCREAKLYAYEGRYEEAKRMYTEAMVFIPDGIEAMSGIKNCELLLWERDHLKYKKVYNSKKQLVFDGDVDGEKFYTGTEYQYPENKREKPKKVQWVRGKRVE
ncbi:MAG TPA: hypothetical protein VK177_10760 [Flavobacteriales bacterium]|nr:hypothetical protein [Flavobacteriales bacterium]